MQCKSNLLDELLSNAIFEQLLWIDLYKNIWTTSSMTVQKLNGHNMENMGLPERNEFNYGGIKAVN